MYWSRMIHRMKPPVFASEEDTRTGRLLYIILVSVLVLAVLNGLAALVQPFEDMIRRLVMTGVVVPTVLVFGMGLRRGHVRIAGQILVIFLWLAFAVLTFCLGGVRVPAYGAFVLITIIAGLLLGGRAALVFAGLTILLGAGYVIGENQGWLIPVEVAARATWISQSIFIAFAAFLLYLATSSLREALERDQQNAQALHASNLELEKIRLNLEDQISERTSDLEQRSLLLQATNAVARVSSGILEPEELVQKVVELIREQFNLYYVGLFLLDPAGEWAILRAGTGSAGQIMLARGHRIQVGAGMIGWSIANALPRVALEREADTVRLATPELPDTRSEAAIPLRSRGKTLGALTIQSTQTFAFGEVTLMALQAMADQVAVALENAHLFAESLDLLKKAQRAYGEANRKAWSEMINNRNIASYRYSHNQIVSIPNEWCPEMVEAVAKDQVVVRQPSDSADADLQSAYIPIRVRQQTIGVLNLNKGAGEYWTEDELALLENLTEQLGIALDSARLYQETQQRALREQIASEVTRRIRETLDVETVLKTAVQEVQKALSLPEVVIRLTTAGQPGNANERGNGSSATIPAAEDSGSPENQASPVGPTHKPSSIPAGETV